jgi:very-short-patch-repair endonuclease
MSSEKVRKRCSGSEPPGDGPSFAPRGTGSIPLQGGVTFPSLTKEARLSLTDGLLPEEVFVAWFLREKLTWREMRKKYGVTRRVFYDTLRHYRPLYSRQLRAIRSFRHARSKYGNRHGTKPHPSVVLNRDRLKRRLREGWRVPQIAREVGCSEFLVSRNIEYHDLRDAQRGTLPTFIGDHNIHLLERLETLHPGVTEAAKNLTNEKAEEFFLRLYKAHLRLLELVWFVQRLGKTRGRYYRSHGPSPICWSLNRGEALLALALEEETIPYARQVSLEKRKGGQLGDFLVDGRLYVEVDGPYHKKSQESDKRKERLMRKTGKPLLRLPLALVESDLQAAMEEIRRALK